MAAINSGNYCEHPWYAGCVDFAGGPYDGAEYLVMYLPLERDLFFFHNSKTKDRHYTYRLQFGPSLQRPRFVFEQCVVGRYEDSPMYKNADAKYTMHHDQW